VPYAPSNNTFLGYNIFKLNNYMFSNIKSTKSSIKSLSNYNYILTNQYMQHRNNTYIDGSKKITIYNEPVKPYKNPFGIMLQNTNFNLVGTKITYTPKNSDCTRYDVTKSQSTTYPDTSSLSPASSPITITLPNNNSFKFNGTNYNSLYINNNGTISFGGANNNTISSTNYFGYKQISMFMQGLTIDTIIYYNTATDIIIYYSAHLSANLNYEAYITLDYTNNTIEVHYKAIDNTNICYIGLSDGSGTDLSNEPVEYSVVDFDKL